MEVVETPAMEMTEAPAMETVEAPAMEMAGLSDRVHLPEPAPLLSQSLPLRS